MKVTITDFYYQGRHFDEFTCELPKVYDMKKPTDEQITECVKSCLQQAINVRESEEGSN